MRKHIVLAPTSDRYIIEVPELVYLTKTLTPSETSPGVRAIETVGTGLKFVPPIGVEVVRAENLTNASALFYEHVSVPGWTWAAGILTLPFITGLDIAVEYRLTLRVSYA